MSAVRPLRDLRRVDEGRFGGKSAGLGELLAAGVRVPPGFALATDEPPREEIEDAYRELAAAAGEPDPPVAVRSSAIGEDSESATFAGQQETVLWVRGVDAVCAAVDRCRASLYSPEAVAYREHLGGGGEPAMGVAVQLMVDAAVSGVLFTCNPVTGDPSVVAINASWGLGAAIVGGEVTPDDYLVSKVTGEVVREQLGDKRLEYVPAQTGVAVREVPPERAAARCLAPEDLSELVAVARAAERHFGAHQDIEWAIARDTAWGPDFVGHVADKVTPGGGVFVVQSRPVTTLPTREVEPAASAISLVMAQFGAARKK